MSSLLYKSISKTVHQRGKGFKRVQNLVHLVLNDPKPRFVSHYTIKNDTVPCLSGPDFIFGYRPAIIFTNSFILAALLNSYHFGM